MGDEGGNAVFTMATPESAPNRGVFLQGVAHISLCNPSLHGLLFQITFMFLISQEISHFGEVKPGLAALVSYSK